MKRFNSIRYLFPFNQIYLIIYSLIIQYDLESTEMPETVKPIVKAMKWIMQYEYANAEELKELAIKEAAEMGEKQENWEEEKEKLNVC